MTQASLLPGILPPLRPWEYIRLRRQSSGKTIAEAARPHWHRPEHRADVERNIAQLEQPGFTLIRDFAIDDLRRSFPLETEVYRQLRDEPPHRHPDVCRGCGCTRWAPCVGRDGCDCTGQESGTCTVCAARAADAKTRRAA